jgi:hypothetical protein
MPVWEGGFQRFAFAENAVVDFNRADRNVGGNERFGDRKRLTGRAFAKNQTVRGRFVTRPQPLVLNGRISRHGETCDPKAPAPSDDFKRCHSCFSFISAAQMKTTLSFQAIADKFGFRHARNLRLQRGGLLGTMQPLR